MFRLGKRYKRVAPTAPGLFLFIYAFYLFFILLQTRFNKQPRIKEKIYNFAASFTELSF